MSKETLLLRSVELFLSFQWTYLLETMRKRCPWVGTDDPLMKEYHDEEWGVSVHGDRKLSKLLWDRCAIAVGAEDYFSRVPAL
ncbi:MAG: hypothetical protein IH630_01860 [Thermoplasmata archaeon]|nr:hypothetical protein [Thermoplasmata archaeon]MCJ7561758.1 DNA-3-methyladenine glycosylase I [Thermoplasmata archaeon]TFG67874.1 MAG: hypothetical protein E4H25_06835 [Methanomassiliicoccus sp.]